MYLRTLLRIAGGCLVLVILTVSLSHAAAEFTADATQTQGDRSKTFQVQVKGTMYALSGEEEGEKITVVVNGETGITRVIAHGQKFFRDMKSDDMFSLMNNPFQAADYTAGMGEVEAAGKETIEGHECDKTVISMSGQPIMTRWKATDLGFYLKIVRHGEPELVISLSNISETEVGDAAFATPEGYTKWVDPATLPGERPEWAGEIESAPVMTPPFEKEMAAGDMVRIKAVPGKSIWVKSRIQGEAQAKAKAIPFKGDRPFRSLDRYNNFAQQGATLSRVHESSQEIDEVVVRVFEGNILLLAKYGEMHENVLAAGEELRVPLSGFDNIELRMVNMANSESVVTWDYYQEGKKMTDDEAGPSQYRKSELAEKGDLKKTVLVQKGDEIVFRCEQGSMLVKAGQYDPFEF